MLFSNASTEAKGAAVLEPFGGARNVPGALENLFGGRALPMLFGELFGFDVPSIFGGAGKSQLSRRGIVSGLLRDSASLGKFFPEGDPDLFRDAMKEFPELAAQAGGAATTFASELAAAIKSGVLTSPPRAMLESSSGSPAKIRLASLKASSLEKKRKRRTSGDWASSARTASIWPSLASERQAGLAESGSAVDLEQRKISSSTPFFHRAVPWSTIRDSSSTPPKRNSDTATVSAAITVALRTNRSKGPLRATT